MLEIGTGRDLTSAHIEAVWHFVGTDCQSGRKLRIPACQLEVERQFRLLVFRRLERQQDALPEQQDASSELRFDRGRQVGLQTAELPLPEHSSELHVPGMGVVSVRYPAAGTSRQQVKKIPQRRKKYWRQARKAALLLVLF